jgi:hypothetical protein
MWLGLTKKRGERRWEQEVKKTHFVHFFDELQRSIESFRNTDNIFDEMQVSF